MWIGHKKTGISCRFFYVTDACSLEVADVIEHFQRFNIEGRVARDMEGLAALVFRPFGFALEADAAAAGIQLHDFRCAGVEGQRGRKNHAHRLAGAIGKLHGMADALADNSREVLARCKV